MKSIYITTSEKQTFNIGKKLASSLRGGEVILLYGDLGSGKTTFAKGVGAGLGIEQPITSPTFMIMKAYNLPQNTQGITSFAHIDTYRMHSEKDLLEVGILDFLGRSGIVCLIEWPEKLAMIFENFPCIKVFLEHGTNPEQRRVEISTERSF